MCVINLYNKKMLTSLFQKIRIYLGLDNPILALRLSLSLLFGLIPFRLLGILQMQLYPRAVLGLLFFNFIFFQSKNLIPLMLNFKFFQIFFYYCLIMDEQFKSIHPFVRVPLFFALAGLFFFALLFKPQFYFTCFLCLFCWSFYRSLKANFINLSSFFCFVSLRSEKPRRDYFTWVDIVENMDNVSKNLFDTSIFNKLTFFMCQTQFRYLTRRVFPTYID